MKRTLTILFACSCALAFCTACGGKKEYHTVSFDGNGFEIGIASQQVEHGKTAKEPQAPSAEGYEFVGWSADALGTEAYRFSSPITQDTVLYACWAVETQAISTAEEFLGMEPDGNYHLAADLDFSDVAFEPIGSVDEPFTGYFDGKGHKLENVSLTSGNAPAVFASLSGTVKNLSVGLTATVTGSLGTVYAGGVVGFLQGGTVERCATDVTIRIDSAESRLAVYAGGIAGRSYRGNIRACTARAEIDVENEAAVYAGGVVGYNGGEAKDYATVASSVHYGNVSAKAKKDVSAAYAGGIVGHNGGIVRDSFSHSASVSAACGDYRAYAGGVAGDNNGGTLIRCLSSANVSAATEGGDTFLGAVAGHRFLDDTMESCYGWNGQELELKGAGANDASARHRRISATTVTARELNSKAWYEGIGLEGWTVEEGKIPYLAGQSEGAAFAKTAAKGTMGNPYEVGTVDALRNMVSGKSYVLTADLELGEWTAIGSYTAPFFGNLDGAGHRLYGVEIKTGAVGIFGYLNGRIKDLRVEIAAACSGNEQRYAGGIAAYGLDAVVEDCFATVDFDLQANGVAAAGIVGYLDGGWIVRCAAEGNIKAASSNPSAYAAGICAVNDGEISQSRSAVSATVVGTVNAYAGGIAAKNLGAVRDCYYTGSVQAANERAAGNVYAGGLTASNEGVLENCYDIGSVIGKDGKLVLSGSVAGSNVGKIVNCFAPAGTSVLGYSPVPTQTELFEGKDLASLAEKLNGERSVWKNGSDRPILSWEEA